MDPIGSASPESKPVLSSVTATPPAPAMRSGSTETRECAFGRWWMVPVEKRGSASNGEKAVAGDTATAAAAAATKSLARGMLMALDKWNTL